MSLTLPTYDQCIKNLSGFVQSLMQNPSKILFLYFTVKKTPYVKTKFGKWEFKSNNSTYYVLPGDDENFAYIYRDSQLKALIDIVSPNAPMPFNASFNASAPYDYKYEVSVIGPSSSAVAIQGEVNVGNHLDFSIRHYTRNQKKVKVISSHLTKYIIHPNGSVTRDAQVQSDFTLENLQPNFIDNLQKFVQILHEVRGLSTGLTIKNIFDQDREWLLPLYNLTRISLGLSQIGGVKNKYHNYQSKKYLINKGRYGGEYIVVNNKRKYIKKQSGGDIENIIMSEKFSEIIYEMFLHQMRNIKKIAGLKVIFDYGHELTDHKDSLHLVLIYEFDDAQTIDTFFIDGETLIRAIEESNNPKVSIRPNIEKLSQMAATCKSKLELMSHRIEVT